jgi:phosphoribosylformylglycinamidine synthase
LDAELFENALSKCHAGRTLFGSARTARVFTLTYNDFSMTAYVYVSLKKSVLDPQGKTIQGALKKMGYQGLEDVRQGKYFEITLDGGLDRDQAKAEVERMAREVLTNPVIEEFRFSLAE